MGKNTSIILSDQLDAFVSREVAKGDFASASEVIRAGLRLLEERQARLEVLRRALVEGEQSGPARPLDMKKIKRKARASRAA